MEGSTGVYLSRSRIPSALVVTIGMINVGKSLNANRVIQIPIPPQAVARIKSWREVVRKGPIEGGES